MIQNTNRIIFSALRGSSGKTLLATGVISALRKQGLNLACFKKGPDFIDAAWLGHAAGHECHHLDSFLMPKEYVRRSFVSNSAAFEGALIEGNRGLFDGVDSKGSHSTAALARELKAPVILIVDCTKVTRTAAAMVLGCMHLEPDIDIKGVILNQIARNRHERVIAHTIEETCGLPILGTVPRFKDIPLRQRHLGLIPPGELPSADAIVAQAAQLAEDYIDLKKFCIIAQCAQPLKAKALSHPSLNRTISPTVGIIRDEAFHFYYPENIEALRNAGAHLIEFSALTGKALPQIDALYIGGGFPEVYAEKLAENISFKKSLKSAVDHGLPVYAECGGAMLLGKSIQWRDQHYPMAGVYPVSFGWSKKPRGHGYTILNVRKSNPFFPAGMTLKGHEFHYSHIIDSDLADLPYIFEVKRGYGLNGKIDGLCYKNMLATYTHVHAAGTRQWAPALVEAAWMYKQTIGKDKELYSGKGPFISDDQSDLKCRISL